MTESELKRHLDAAEKSPKQIAAAVSGLPEKTLRYKPSPDKWCILEILGHVETWAESFGAGRAAEERCDGEIGFKRLH